MEFLGRIDHQVKIRGYRIELGEIETALRSLDTIREAVVVAREDSPGQSSLVAYLVVTEDAGPTVAEFRDSLQQRLPSYMVPSAFVRLEALPRLPSGKVDRRSLPDPDPAQITAAAPHVPPRTPTEEKLVEIWSEVLGVERVGVRDNFFELGGHSLSAMRLISKVRNTFDTTVAIPSLFQGPTIELLARTLDAPVATLAESCLIPLRTSGQKPPMFCVHGSAGLAIQYADLMPNLDPQQPLYGIQAAGLSGEQSPFTRIEDMAGHYLQAVCSIQSEGPYILVGHSFGGLVVLEMAQQLVAENRDVGLLAVIDMPAAGYLPRVSPQKLRTVLIIQLVREIEQVVKVDLPVVEEELQSLPVDEQFQYVYQLLERQVLQSPQADEHEDMIQALLSGGPLLLRGLMRVTEASLEALQNYRPRPYPGKVTLFCAQQRVVHDLGGPPADLLADPSWGWDQIAAQPTETHVVPGNHFSMLAEPHARVLAEQLQTCCDQELSNRQLMTTP